MAGHAQIQEQRSSKRPLHNFTLPSKLKWGHQKNLRCGKSTPSENPNSTPHTHTTTTHFVGDRKSPISGDDEIQVVREKLMTDFRMATDQLKLNILDDKPRNNNNEKKTSEKDLNSIRPWNLRTRRAACKAPIDACGVMRNEKLSPLRCETVVDKAEAVANNGQRVRFSKMLTKGEIEKDFLAITGAKPHRRPKKRPRIVQKQLDAISPGLWLSEITPEMYKVEEDGEHARQRK